VIDLPPGRAELDLDKVWVLFGASLTLRKVAEDSTGRCFTGVLASDRSWYHLPVEVEVAPWSKHRTELTLRLLGNTRRPGWARWYLRHGSAFADLLSAAMRTPLDIRTAAPAAAVTTPSLVA
jgi:hypothetical protein